MVDISTAVGIDSVGAKKGQRWKQLADNFPKTYVWFGIGTLLLVERSRVENRTRGASYTLSVVYGM